MAAPGSSQLLLVLMLVTIISAAESQMMCSDVETGIAPCLCYLTGTGPLTTSCCSAVSNLYTQVSSNPTMLTAVCQCLQTLASSIPDLNLDNCANLPEQCGVSHPFTISPNINCYNL